MLYFAYGSNLNHYQMQERCKDCKYIKNTFLEGYKLSFCAVSRSYGVANVVKKTGSKVPGGLWKISSEDEKILYATLDKEHIESTRKKLRFLEMIS